MHFNTHVFMFCTQQLFNIQPTFLNTWVKELQRRLKVWITTYRGIDFPYNTWVWRVYTSWLYLYFPRVYGTTCLQRQPPPPPSTNEEPHLSNTHSNTCSRKKNKTTNLNATSVWTRLTKTYLNYHLIFGSNIRIS